jgi:recombination protein RecR
MKLSKPIQKLIDEFEKLPGIGPKTAQRLTFYLLHFPQKELNSFARAVARLKKDTEMCSLCYNVTESDPCPICLDNNRDQQTICVVEQPLDILAFEKGGFYQGVYHVLHGVINPLDNIGPDDLYLAQLLPRIKENNARELIIATNPTTEGEATAMYVSRLVNQKRDQNEIFADLQVTRIGRGLPTGADLQYADDQTLNRAFEGRSGF